VTPPPAAAARLDHVSVTSSDLSSPEKSAPARADRPFRGIALILLSTIFLGTSDVTAKYLSSSMPSIEIAWLRFLVFGLIMMPAMVRGSPLYAMQTTRPGFQLLRGVALLGSSLFFITGLKFLPIAEASATGFVAPLFVTALSIFFLGEIVGLRRWLATAVASQRRRPTRSPRKKIDSAVTNSGETKPVADASAIGRNRKPVMKNSDDPSSATPRHS
jgi:hypothetical protein